MHNYILTNYFFSFNSNLFLSFRFQNGFNNQITLVKSVSESDEFLKQGPFASVVNRSPAFLFLCFHIVFATLCF
jgi:hypothetical protein